MKFTCDTKTLKHACDTARRAATAKSSLPALEGLLLRCERSADDREVLHIAGYDLEVCIQTEADVLVQEPGACVLDAALLCSILAKLGDDNVTIEVDKKSKAQITAGGSVFKLNAMDASEFPELPATAAGTECMRIPADTLQGLIRGTVFAASTNLESKPIHTGVLFECEGGTLTCVGIDGFRAAVRRSRHDGTERRADSVDFAGEQGRFVVPQKALREIAGMKDLPERAGIFLHKRHITFELGEVQITSRLLDGEFMNWSAAVPTQWEQELTIERAALLAAIERVALIIDSKIKTPLRVTVCPDRRSRHDGTEDGTIALECATGVGTASERVPAQGCAQAVEIGFNHHYLLDALKACDDDLVKLRASAAVAPAVIVPPEGDAYLQLVLPVRLKSDDGV